MVSTQKAIAQLDELLEEYAALSRHVNDAPSRAKVLMLRLETAIKRIAPPSSVYAKQAEMDADWAPMYKLEQLVPIASAMRDDIKAGWFESIIELVHADTYNDFLEMAEGLLDGGYKDAAAVITGTSLEVHLRSLCGKNGVSTEVNGKPKKADTMNADLKKVGAFGALEQKQVTAWLDLRNSAAHGDYGKYDETDVKHFISGVRVFMSKFPA